MFSKVTTATCALALVGCHAGIEQAAPAAAPRPDVLRPETWPTLPQRRAPTTPCVGVPAREPTSPSADLYGWPPPALSPAGDLIAVVAETCGGPKDGSCPELRLLSVDRDRIVSRVTIPEHLGSWLTLKRYAPAPLDVYGPHRGQGLVVAFTEPLITVRLGKRLVVSQHVPAWSRTPPGRCGHPVLGEVHGARARGVLVVTLRFEGGWDMCWEPDPTHHVVRLPPAVR